MSERAVTRMSTEEFLDWGLHQEPRHQLVDGVAVTLVGTRQQHDQIVANTHGILYNLIRGKAMRGKKWRYFTVDLGVRIPAGNIRCPDAGVDRGVFDSDAMTAGAPYLVLEVLSPSVRDFDMFGKLEEYKTIRSRCAPGVPLVTLFGRSLALCTAGGTARGHPAARSRRYDRSWEPV